MWTLGIVVAALLIAVSNGAYVSSVHPQKGSLGGGTRLTTYGSGFSADQFNQNDDPATGNKVYLVSASGMEYECPVHKDGSTETQIMCDTPERMSEENYYVKVVVDNTTVENEDLCGGNPESSQCTFKPEKDYTPVIDTFGPSSGPPDTFLTMRGKLFSDRYSSNNATASNGKTELLQRAYVGDTMAALKFPENDTLYGLALDNETSDYGVLICKSPATLVGNFNVSFLLQAPYGRSFPNAGVSHVSINDTIYMFQQYASISRLSTNNGSVEGLLLTLYVDNVSGSLRAYVGGIACRIVAVGLGENVTIEVPAYPDFLDDLSLFPGNRGGVLKYWTETTKDINTLDSVRSLTSSSPGYHNTTLDETCFLDDGDTMDNYVSELTTFFIPPYSGDYMFYLRGDDGAKLFFNGEANAIVTSENNEWVTSERKTLDSSQRYLLEIVHFETTGDSSFCLKVKYFNTTLTGAWTDNVVDEKQNITVSSPVTDEKQEIEFVMPSQKQTPTNEVQTVKVNATADTEFRFCLYGVCTELLTIQKTDSELGNSIKAIPVFGKEEGVIVERLAVEGDPSYDITFDSKQGNFPALTVEPQLYSPPRALNYQVTEKVPGVPDNEMVALMLDGIISKPFKTLDYDTVLEAVVSLFEAKCPDVLLSSTSDNILNHQESFEAYPGKFTGPRVKDTEPFCGRYALKCEANMYKKDEAESGILLTSYGTLCFAYKGFLQNSIEVTFSYKPSLDSESETQKIDIAFKTDEDTWSETWSYVCLNVYNKIIASYSGGTDYRLQKVAVFNQTADDPCYVDAVSIGQKNRTNDPDVNKLRLRPAQPNNALIDRVRVRTISSNVFEVTLKPFECGHRFPLLTLAKGETSGSFLYTSTSVNFQLVGGEGAITVTRKSAASPPATGKTDVTFKGKTIRGLNITLDPKDIANQFESLGIGAVSVTKEGDCANFNLTVTFLAQPSDQEQMIVSNKVLDSTEFAVSAHTVVDAGIFYNPIQGDMLRTAEAMPQVILIMNEVPTACAGNCSFEWLDSKTPAVTSVNPTSGTLASGTSVVISGTGFSTDQTKNTVTIGDVACSVTGATATTVTCNVGNGGVGQHRVIVNVDGKGYSSGDVQFEYTAGITDVQPTSGSIGGGLTLTIDGYGFMNGALVTINAATCAITSVQPGQIQCTVPAASAEGTHDVKVQQGSAPQLSYSSYTYSSSQTAVVSSREPAVLLVTGGRVTVDGTFTSTPGTVSLGSVNGTVASWTATQIVADFSAVPPGTHQLRVMEEHGYAAHLIDGIWNIPNISAYLNVTNVSPQKGSLQGGTNLTITGSSFGTDPAIVLVKVGSVECENPEVTNTKIVCKLGSAATTHYVYNNGSSSGSGYGFNPSYLNITVGEYIDWQWNVPSHVKDIVWNVIQVDGPGNISATTGGFRGGGPSKNGHYRKQFTQAGTYYVSSGYVNPGNSLVFFGTINVAEANSWNGSVSVNVGGFDAAHVVGGSSDPSDSSTCKSTTSAKSSCGDSISTGGDSTKFNYWFSKCHTPIVRSISEKNGTSETSIVISGEGLSAIVCQNDVWFGSHQCEVASSSETSVTCKFAESGEPELGVLHPLSMNVNNRGYALVEPMSEENKSFALIPRIASITPTIGSLAGGAPVTIRGFGFGNSPSVSFSGSPSEILESTYTEIICESPPSTTNVPERNITVSADVSDASLPARCETASKTCKFLYSASWTSSVESIQPDTMSGPTTVTITGSKLGTNPSDLDVTIGGVTAEVASATDDSLTATIENAPAGENDVIVKYKNYGKASGSGTLKMDSSLTVSAVNPSSGSIHGGAVISIQGNGFIDNETEVSVGGTQCDVFETTLSAVKCVTNAHEEASVDITVESNEFSTSFSSYSYSSASTPTITSVSPTSGLPGDTLTITGSNLNGETVIVSLDDADCSVTVSSNTEIRCTLGNHSTGSVPVVVNVTGLGLSDSDTTFEYLLSLDSISPTDGSLAGGQTCVVSGAGFEDSATVTICGETCTMKETTSTQYTCRTPANTAQTCDVVMSLNGLSKTLSGSYTYRADLTASVSNVSPRRGGTGGGTTLTITGSGFGSDANDVEVMIGDTDCAVSAATDTEIVCVTGEHSGSIDTKVEVQVSGNGIADEDGAGAADFSYIDVWSSLFTWGGGPLPQEGEFVVVPAGMKLLLDMDTPILSFLLIQGQLIFDDQTDLELQSENILITDGGLLQVGTESEPFQHNGVITLHGTVRSTELPLYGAKALAVRNGTLDLHGKEVPLTWTRLASTATAGSTTISLQHSVDWNVGDVIVIATTGHKHSQAESEEKIITAISDDGLTLTLESALEYEHLSVVETYGGTTVEMRAEVGLVSHNVLVRGNRNTGWNDVIAGCEEGFDTGEFTTQTCFLGRFGEEEGSDQFGATVIIHAPVKDHDIAAGRFSNVEFKYVGQAFRLGRYPVHFHLNGFVSRSYVRKCGIHESFNRAVNIHGTHNVTVENTVIYNIMGGAFFLEDGIETVNVIQYNLAVFVKASTSLQNDDITPACFWVTNPNNTIRHNAAAGGTHFGFWYRMHEHPDGPSYDPNICPDRTGLGVFSNNSAHGFGWFGLWIFPDYFPRETQCEESEVEPAVFSGLFAWNNEKGAESVDCGSVQIEDSILFGNELAGYEAKKYLKIEGALYTDRGPMIKNSLIVAHSTDIHNEDICTRGGVVFGYGQGFRVIGVSFYNFDQSDCTAFRMARIDGTCGIYCGMYVYHTEGLTFQNSPNKHWFAWKYEGVYLDKDGSALGSTEKAGWTVLPCLDSQPDDCVVAPEFSIGPVDGCMCPHNYKWHAFSFTNEKFFGRNVLITSDHGTSICHFAEKRLRTKNSWACGLLGNSTSTIAFENAGDLSMGTNFSMKACFEGFGLGDYLIIRFKMAELPDRFSIDGSNSFIDPTEGSLDVETGTTGNWTYDSDTNYVQVLVHHNETKHLGSSFSGMSSYSVDRCIDLVLYKCPTPNCEPVQDINTIPPASSRPDNFLVWDSETLWNDSNSDDFVSNTNGTSGVPGDYANVLIVNETWVIVNKTTTFNKLGTLILEGVLEFVDTVGANYVIEVDVIIIRCGRLIIGWPDDPFDGLAQIIVRGNQSTPYYDIGDGPVLGSKAIGVFGGLDLFGEDVERTWTELAEKALSGSNKITVEHAVGWSVGDEIVIGPTSFNPWETEIRKITALDDDRVELTLNSTLDHLHTAYRETLDNGQEIKVGAAVGLLTRNIKIVGQEYEGLYTDSYGARVLVGTATYNGQTCTGYARVKNVEFYNTGQEGFTDDFDRRDSLVYSNTGTVSVVKPSAAIKNSFHNGFSAAIAAVGIDGLNITDNVVVGAVGDGLKVSSNHARVVSNLVALVVNPATYQDRYEAFNLEATAGIEAVAATDLTLQDNLVTGAEGIAFHVPPQDCDDNSDNYQNNKGYANVIAGVAVLPGDVPSQVECAKIAGYTVWKNHDYGLYYQDVPSVNIENFTSIENPTGLFAIVLGPDPIAHLFDPDKTIKVQSSTFVGQTDSSDCSVDVTPSDDNYRLSGNARHIKASDDWCGLTFGTFTAGDNGLPTHPYDGIMKYASINGRTILNDITFARFSQTSCRSYFAVCPNKANDDGTHPVESGNITLLNVEEDNKVFYPRPNLGKINSADCVDMDCDGLKKSILKDLDGTFLGHPGTVIPDSAYEWDGDPRRGLGDYRIPKEMLTDANGNRLSAGDVCPNKGIIRSDGCEFKDSWQAYDCPADMNYEMLIIESMDEDTETRRLSPVGILGNGYIDLINGPQDHGWCSGYTCRKRLSTFMAIVATDIDYLLHFTSVTPKDLRFRLLNVDPDEGVKMTVWYAKPNRLDLYLDDVFVPAKNSRIDNNGKYVFDIPTGDEYDPQISDGTGQNFHDKNTGKFSFIIKGPQKIDVISKETIIVAFNLPGLTADEFFGPNIVNNIATFLGIPAEKVRVVNVVSASASRRRKRSDAAIIVYIEVGDQPLTYLNETAPDSLDYYTLLEIASNLTNECLVGNLSESFNITGECLTVDVAPSDTASESIVYSISFPDHLFFVEEPAALYEGSPLQTQPKIRVVDISNVVLTELGTAEYPWQITASLRAGTGHPAAMLNGTLTVSSSNGWFNFTDLVISHMGSGYILDFQVSFPVQAQNLILASAAFDVAGRSVKINVFDQSSGDIVRNDLFFLTIDLQDLNTDETITDIAWRDHTWTAEVRLLEVSEYASLDGTLTSSFDSSVGRAMFPDLNITGFGIFYLQLRVVSNPTDYNLTYNHKLSIKSPDHVGMTIEEEKEMKVKFDAAFMTVLPTVDLQNGFEQMVLTMFSNWWPEIYISSGTINEGSIVVTLSVAGTASSVNTTAYSLCGTIYNQTAFSYNGYSLTLLPYLTVNDQAYYGVTCGDMSEDEESEGLADYVIAIAVLVPLLLIIAVVVVVVWRCMVKPKTQTRNIPVVVKPVTCNTRFNYAAHGSHYIGKKHKGVGDTDYLVRDHSFTSLRGINSNSPMPSFATSIGNPQFPKNEYYRGSPSPVTPSPVEVSHELRRQNWNWSVGSRTTLQNAAQRMQGLHVPVSPHMDQLQPRQASPSGRASPQLHRAITPERENSLPPVGDEKFLGRF